MKFDGTLQYKNKTYKLVFNLNVMEAIQEEYGSVDKWGSLTDGQGNGEPDAKAGLRQKEQYHHEDSV